MLPPLPPAQCTAQSESLPRGFTLAELLVASTIALVIMGALASLLGVFSRASTNSQSIVDMTNRMRSAANRLRQDLAGVTTPVAPPVSPESVAGYFEIVEGPMQDGLATTGAGAMIYQSGKAVWASGTTSLLADTDDALLFTTRSLAGPFEGKFDTSQIESTTAEVAWFCRPSATQPVQGLTLQTLYRRQLLVVGYAGASPFYAPGSSTNNQITGTLPAAYNTYDISLRIDPTVSNALVPNTLADLGQRENRFFHGSILVHGTAAWKVAFPSSTTGLTFDSASGREGEDVVLTNVIGFDVRVFDPDARPKMNGTILLYPNEQAYSTFSGICTPPLASGTCAASFRGCFLDLGGNAIPTLPTYAMNVLVPDSITTGTFSAISTLSGDAAPKSKLAATYDTWTTFYESNGVDEDGDGVVDEGTNGVDNSAPADGIPDDPVEDETAPPYPTPLRAIEIRIRCYDPTSREIRQVTVRQAFST